jgi:hypothetical protein
MRSCHEYMTPNCIFSVLFCLVIYWEISSFYSEKYKLYFFSPGCLLKNESIFTRNFSEMSTNASLASFLLGPVQPNTQRQKQAERKQSSRVHLASVLLGVNRGLPLTTPSPYVRLICGPHCVAEAPKLSRAYLVVPPFFHSPLQN